VGVLIKRAWGMAVVRKKFRVACGTEPGGERGISQPRQLEPSLGKTEKNIERQAVIGSAGGKGRMRVGAYSLLHPRRRRRGNNGDQKRELKIGCPPFVIFQNGGRGRMAGPCVAVAWKSPRNHRVRVVKRPKNIT